jgi:hypothetical protein
VLLGLQIARTARLNEMKDKLNNVRKKLKRSHPSYKRDLGKAKWSTRLVENKNNWWPKGYDRKSLKSKQARQLWVGAFNKFSTTFQFVGKNDYKGATFRYTTTVKGMKSTAKAFAVKDLKFDSQVSDVCWDRPEDAKQTRNSFRQQISKCTQAVMMRTIHAVDQSLMKAAAKSKVVLCQLKKIIAAITGGLKKLGKLAGKAVKAVGKAAGKAVKAAGKVAGKAAKAVGKAAGKAVKAAGKVAGKAVKAAGKVAGKAVKAASKGAKKATKAVSKKAKKVFGGRKGKLRI